jgi:hypothetical protein
MHGWTVHMHQCTPASSHAWLGGSHLRPCMAGQCTCISVSPPPAIHGLTARARVCSSSLLLEFARHAWLDGEHASVYARLQPCMA